MKFDVKPRLKMAKVQLPILILVIILSSIPFSANGLVPFGRTLWDQMDDPFRILEQTPIPLSRPNIDGPGTMGLALARADWKETQTAHIITLDVPGIKREDIKVEVEENRVVRVSGERKSEDEQEGDKWHRVERTSGKFWRQFRLPGNSDLDRVKAHLEDGVLRISVPKLVDEKKKKPKVVDIVEESSFGGQDVKPTKADM